MNLCNFLGLPNLERHPLPFINLSKLLITSSLCFERNARHTRALWWASTNTQDDVPEVSIKFLLCIQGTLSGPCQRPRWSRRPRRRSINIVKWCARELIRAIFQPPSERAIAVLALPFSGFARGRRAHEWWAGDKGDIVRKKDLLTEKTPGRHLSAAGAALVHEMNLILRSQWRTDFPRVNGAAAALEIRSARQAK